MVTWCKRHPIQFMALYLVFYLSFFTLLESSVVPTVILHCRLDDMIPFVKYAIIPYYLWFLWIVGTLFWQLYRAPQAGVLAAVPAAVCRHDPGADDLRGHPQRR